jgi:hypothetical protein
VDSIKKADYRAEAINLALMAAFVGEATETTLLRAKHYADFMISGATPSQLQVAKNAMIIKVKPQKKVKK